MNPSPRKHLIFDGKFPTQSETLTSEKSVYQRRMCDRFSNVNSLDISSSGTNIVEVDNILLTSTKNCRMRKNDNGPVN